jgi:hypothetical protein
VLLLAWVLPALVLLLVVLLRVLAQQPLELPWPWVLPAPPTARFHSRR